MRARQAESAQLLDLLFDRAGVGLCLVAPDGKVLRANEEWLRSTGHERDRIVGEDFLTLYPDAREAVRALSARSRAGETVEIPRHPQRVDGRETWWEGRVSSVPMEGGTGFLVTARDVSADVTRQRAADAALVEREERLRLAVEGCGMVVWQVDAVTGLARVDEGGATLLGLPPDMLEFPHELFLERVHPADREHVARCFREAIEHGGELGFEFRAVVPDGSVRWIGSRGRTLRGPDGAALRVIGIAHEVTERRRAEEAARAGERFLRKVIDATPSMVFVKDREGRFVLANEALARCYGAPVHGVLGRTDADFNSNAEEVAAFLRDDRAVMDGRRERRIPEEPVTTADGEVRWFSTVKVPLVEDDGSCGKVLGVATDITERKRAEEALRHGEERFRRLVESSVIGLAIGDDTGRISYVNEVLLAMLGYERDELAGGKLRWDALTPPEVLPVTAKALAELRATGRTEPYEKVYIAKDGRRVPVLVSILPIDRGPAGELVLAAYVVDLTARIRTEEALRASEEALREGARRKDEFLATLSHELRNPLAAIASAARVIHARWVAGQDVERPIQILERQVRNSARLLEDLLDVSRITRGLVQLKKETVLLETVIHGAVDSQRALIDAAGHRLSITLPHEPIAVEADPTRLEQIFSNLLNNAVKYTPDRGRIALVVERVGDEVAVRVADTGKGIPPDLLPRVFDLFVQEQQCLARSKGGLGLGLTLVRKLAEMHGGTVEAQSAGPGAGSEFVVRLPVASRCPPPPAAHPRASGAPGTGGGGRRVLVVEDNFDAAELLAEYLSSLGHEVTVAHDGTQALDAAVSARPEVVLLDIGLPGMDGYEVARRLARDGRAGAPVLIALTGYGQEEDRLRSRAAGFAHHLTKPFEPAALERLLAGLGRGDGAEA